MGNHRNKPRSPGMSLEPLEVLTFVIRSFLTNHREVIAQEDYNLIDGALRGRHWKILHEWASAQSPFWPEHVEQAPNERYFVYRQIAAIVRKFPFTPQECGFTPEETALAGFHASEHRCRRTNSMLRSLFTGPRLNRLGSPVGSRLELYQFIDGARRFIKQVLGAVVPLPEVYASCDFSGGASVGVHGNATHIGRKLLADVWTCTPTCVGYAFSAIMTNHHYRSLLCPVPDRQDLVSPHVYRAAFEQKVRLVEHNKVEFVPKTAKTHRVIATEPLLNGFIQNGVQKVMRQKMLAFGLDIRQGWRRNQKLAYDGSIETDLDKAYATLDLSSASDSISVQLAKALLPESWFLFLNEIRSPGYSLDRVKARSEKFCSMGNGFCFPLETLIFAAFARQAALAGGYVPDYCIFGDDIIVRRPVVQTLVKMLVKVGFRLNMEKSYWSGPFRESCGADWVRGTEVTPVYMRKRIDRIPMLINFHNSLDGRCFGRHSRFPDVARDIREFVPPSRRYVELREQGLKPKNHGFVVELDEFMASPHTRWDAPTRSFESKRVSTTPMDDEDWKHPLRNGVEYVAVLRGAKASQPLALRRETRTRVDFVSQSGRDRRMMIASRMYLPLL